MILQYSKPLRYFCGFAKVPDTSKIIQFKHDLQSVFDNLVDYTEPICQAIYFAKTDMTIYDSSGIEAFVTENNPKYANSIIKQLKAYAKAMNFDKSYALYKVAYGPMLLLTQKSNSRTLMVIFAMSSNSVLSLTDSILSNIFLLQ